MDHGEGGGGKKEREREERGERREGKRLTSRVADGIVASKMGESKQAFGGERRERWRLTSRVGWYCDV